MGEIIEFNLGGSEKEGGKKNEEFFPSGELISGDNLLVFTEKIHIFPMSPKDKNEVLKKVKELAEAEELQEIAINKSLYLKNLQNLQKYDMSRLIEILKNNSLEYFKNDVPFAKAVLDSILVEGKQK